VYKVDANLRLSLTQSRRYFNLKYVFHLGQRHYLKLFFNY
jgi:hypothetical protein